LPSLEAGTNNLKMQTNLAATTAARKERLIALRNRKKAVEQGDGNGESYVYMHLKPSDIMYLNFRSHFTFKQRNFDPETRQLRNREREDAGEDTVEKAVEGLAEEILKEDEEKRKEELVRFLFLSYLTYH
jgi:coiled-coil domain-containing protein 12